MSSLDHLRREPPRPPSRLLFVGRSFACGSFRAPVDLPGFADAGQPTSYQFVFPRTSVWIEPSGGPPYLADATVVTFYNDGDSYRRRPISPEGDLGEWFDVAPELLSEMLWELGLETAGQSLFPFSHGPADAASYLTQRRVFHHVVSGEPVDALFVEEALMQALWRVLERSGARRRAERGDAPPATCATRAVAQVRSFAAANLGERLTLDRFAAEIGASPFQICRWFKSVTGRTLHAWLTDLRLRTSLALIAEWPFDLSRVAVEVGFASHSHFTTSFRRAFGCSPSQFRTGRARRVRLDSLADRLRC